MPDISIPIGTTRLVPFDKPILLKQGCCGVAKSTAHAVYQIHLLEGLSTQQTEALSARYINLVETTRIRARVYAYIFHIGRTIVTVGSLIVPALLSIQYTSTGPSGLDSTSLSYVIYWITWFVSLLVTTCNGILTLFKVDKKYHLLHTTLEQYKTEVWQYIHLSGKYGKIIENQPPSHSNQYIFFTYNLEKIRMRMVQEEYFKLTDGKEQPRDQPAAVAPVSSTVSGSGASGSGARSVAVQEQVFQEQVFQDTQDGSLDTGNPNFSPAQVNQLIHLFNSSTPDPVQQRLGRLQQQQQQQQQQRQQQIKQLHQQTLPNIPPILDGATEGGTKSPTAAAAATQNTARGAGKAPAITTMPMR